MSPKLSNRIGTLRADKGWSQRDLAKRVGLSNQQISNLESGKSDLTTGAIDRFADAFGCHPAAVIGLEIDTDLLRVAVQALQELVESGDYPFTPAQFAEATAILYQCGQELDDKMARAARLRDHAITLCRFTAGLSKE